MLFHPGLNRIRRRAFAGQRTGRNAGGGERCRPSSGFVEPGILREIGMCVLSSAQRSDERGRHV